MSPVPQKTLKDLAWPQFLNIVAKRSANEISAEQIKKHPFFNNDDAVAHMRLISELVTCIDNDDPPPLLDALPTRAALLHLRSDGAIGGDAFVAIAHNLKLFVSVHRYFNNRLDVCPQNASLLLPEHQPTNPLTLAKLAAEIEATLNTDGTIRDNATQELFRLKKRLTSLRQNLLDKMESFAVDHQDVLRDTTVTIRNDRYVLPLRTDASGTIAGIVHGTSGTGATMFVEPGQMVEAGNQLTLTREEIAREETRILSGLRNSVAAQLNDVVYATQKVIETEIRIAMARVCWDLGANVPHITDDGRFHLVDARHPLMVLQKTEVIPNDISLNRGNILLISGPNAGGKTVVLKTVGFIGLMLKAGLPISADSTSTVSIPANVLSDIGDDQSIDGHLSTFSAHMKNIAQILTNARAGSIVLLDETAAGTDPAEGWSLAAGILEALSQKGVHTVATTHFDHLKTHAQDHPAFSNAAMGYDPQKNCPTYKLKGGVPGQSSALATARNYGIPGPVIERATALLPEGSRRLARAVMALEEATAKQIEKAAALKKATAEAETTRSRYEQQRAKLTTREEKFIDKEREQLWKAIKAARQTIRDVEKTVRRKKNPVAVKQARDQVNQVARKLEAGEAMGESIDQLPGRVVNPKELSAGDQVFVTTMNKTGLVEPPVRGNTVFVRIGAVRIKVSISELRLIASAKAQQQRHTAGPSRKLPTLKGDALRTEENTLDLRGCRIDDAIGKTEIFFDRALQEQHDLVYLLTGVGTGKLMAGMEEYLKRSIYVDHFRPGNEDEGGDAVLAVTIK